MSKRTPVEQKRYERQKAWREANPEKQRGYSKKYHHNNLEKRHEKDRRYHAANKLKRAVQHRTWRLKAKYNLTRDEVEFMSLIQGDSCSICRALFEGNKVCVDHDHTTGKVRGLLCDLCNRGIGLLGDSPSRLRVAAQYIEQHKERK